MLATISRSLPASINSCLYRTGAQGSFTRITLLLLCCCLAGSPRAAILSIDLRAPAVASALDDLDQGSLLVDGLQVTFAAIPGSINQGLFNQTASRFGINTLGTGADSPSLIDAVGGVSEFLTIRFSDSVLLDRIVLSAFSPGERALLVAGSSYLFPLDGMLAAVDEYPLAGGIVRVGETLVLSHMLGNGFSFERLDVEVFRAPEPATWGLLMTAILLLRAARTRTLRCA